MDLEPKETRGNRSSWTLSSVMTSPAFQYTIDAGIYENDNFEHPDNRSSDNEPVESYTHQDHKESNVKIYMDRPDPETEISDSGQGNGGSSPEAHSGQHCLDPNEIETDHVYLNIIGDKEYLTRHTSAISDVYLEVPYSGLENLTESDPSESRGTSFHSYQTIDIPVQVVCPLPPQTSFDHISLEGEKQGVESRCSVISENEYEIIEHS